MARPLRVNYPNAWYHVMNRGAGGKDIFKNRSHKQIFLNLLKEAHEMFNVKICAYCLMDNHYHLLLTTPDANLSRVMRHINGVYTQLYNRSENTDGPLFRGRYKAKLIEDDCYQLTVSRYIHMNPVEAGLINNPADYEWSSYSAYVSLARVPNWLSVDIILNNLNKTTFLSEIKGYKEYVEEKNVDEINIYSSIKNVSPIFGSEMFKQEIIEKISGSTPSECLPDVKRVRTIPEIKAIMRCICKYYSIQQIELIKAKKGFLNWPRLVCMYICRKKYAYPLKEIAQAFELSRPEHAGTEINKCSVKLLKNPLLLDEVNAIYEGVKSPLGIYLMET